jgi:DNA-binding transcriptional regulator GbsR (MarR family)
MRHSEKIYRSRQEFSQTLDQLHQLGLVFNIQKEGKGISQYSVSENFEIKKIYKSRRSAKRYINRRLKELKNG